ncbi:TIGR03086 family metal-binding protein [Actinomadura rudentiformis]|uniref:TIGR03086 family protein n=1 Tax=Actinomadura rudentiformis TaxID=359158 RepID=A0A6H9YKL2_9ACTN|nr:TIGR03086 family metal-binding protein [Actinomadura rudentiformis]KAB2346128.1 TIGR03086 family protein [Actinomadura rudentiformis]
MTDIRELDRQAVLTSVDIVSTLTAPDLDRPTPCEGWTVRDLLAHMTVQHHGFAAASHGEGGDLAVWAVQPLADDPVKAYAEAAETVIAAFAEPGALDRTFTLAEFGGQAFPAPMAMSFHFIDYVVHGWDMARALGRPFELAEELADTALEIALAVPDDERFRKPGAAFRPALPTSGETPLDRILTHLGRSPAWPA